jgi:hypothetical protein
MFVCSSERETDLLTVLMWVILLLFALVSVINGKLQITTTSSSVTIRHFVDDNQKYIQLLTNDDESLQLNCRSDDDSSTFIQWHLPNNSVSCRTLL